MKCWNQIWLCWNVAIVLSRLNPVAGSVKYPVYENRRHRQLFCWSQLGSEVQRTNHNSFHFPPILFIISNPSTIIIILNERILFYPGPRGFLLMFFFYLEICDVKRWSKRRAGRKRKPLVKIVENLTFMLAQHLTVVKDVIFFWPITS